MTIFSVSPDEPIIGDDAAALTIIKAMLQEEREACAERMIMFMGWKDRHIDKRFVDFFRAAIIRAKEEL